jgi:hypothetical protein
MQYQQRTEKPTNSNDNSIPTKPLGLNDLPELRRTRLILLFLIGIYIVSF